VPCPRTQQATLPAMDVGRKFSMGRGRSNGKKDRKLAKKYQKIALFSLSREGGGQGKKCWYSQLPCLTFSI